jgi:hypothetical protein
VIKVKANQPKLYQQIQQHTQQQKPSQSQTLKEKIRDRQSERIIIKQILSFSFYLQLVSPL